jgi:hypothetical protein
MSGRVVRRGRDNPHNPKRRGRGGRGAGQDMQARVAAAHTSNTLHIRHVRIQVVKAVHNSEAYRGLVSHDGVPGPAAGVGVKESSHGWVVASSLAAVGCAPHRTSPPSDPLRALLGANAANARLHYDPNKDPRVGSASFFLRPISPTSHATRVWILFGCCCCRSAGGMSLLSQDSRPSDFSSRNPPVHASGMHSLTSLSYLSRTPHDPTL